MSRKTCLCCSSYNAIKEWCNYYEQSVEPSDSCDLVDDDGSYGGSDEKLCCNCSSFDPNYEDGWCDYKHCRTSESGYCKKFTW